MGAIKVTRDWESFTVTYVRSLPNTRKLALEQGSEYFFNKPCKHGHVVAKRTKLNDCPLCTRMRQRATLPSIRHVLVFSMLVDMNRRVLGFRGLQYIILKEDSDYEFISEFAKLDALERVS